MNSRAGFSRFLTDGAALYPRRRTSSSTAPIAAPRARVATSRARQFHRRCRTQRGAKVAVGVCRGIGAGLASFLLQSLGLSLVLLCLPHLLPFRHLLLLVFCLVFLSALVSHASSLSVLSRAPLPLAGCPWRQAPSLVIPRLLNVLADCNETLIRNFNGGPAVPRQPPGNGDGYDAHGTAHYFFPDGACPRMHDLGVRVSNRGYDRSRAVPPFRGRNPARDEGEGFRRTYWTGLPLMNLLAI